MTTSTNSYLSAPILSTTPSLITAVNTFFPSYLGEPATDPLAAVIVAEQQAQARWENGILGDAALAFSSVASGDIMLAQRIADNFLNLMFEGGAFSQWRYRIFSKYLSDGD